MDEEDSYDSACAQQEQDERRRREDEALERHGVLLARFKQDRLNFERATKAWNKRMTAARAAHEQE